MPVRRTHLTTQSSHGQLAAALAALRTELEVPLEFPEAALAEATTARAITPMTDLREIPFVTLDPVGSRDLDQAFHIERIPDELTGGPAGWVVRYAIADLPGFVAPGGAIDLAARDRGQTLYLPDGSIPLHPRTLSEDRASLLAGQDRSAFVWTVRLDADGVAHEASVTRALVRSREQLDYPGAQLAIDRGTAAGALALLPEVGKVRIAQEHRRGGASLNMPEEEVVRGPDGYLIERRFPLPVEEWNAQLSLLVGIVAGEMMLHAGIGILRIMPEPLPEALREFRNRVGQLGQPWDTTLSYGEYLRGLDRTVPGTPAVLQAAAALFRGADYVAFDGALPGERQQAAIAASYAHVTAPLRRLVDRWGLVVCEAISERRPIPQWARETLPQIPQLMRASIQRSGQIGSAALDRVEAALLRDRVGDELDAVVVEVRGSNARVQIADPAVTASCPADGLVAGTRVRVRVVSADIATGKIALVATSQ